MGRDTIQLEDVVSTISHEYLLEFTSEYSIPESLHPELPGLEEPMVEFSEGKVGVYTKFFEFANYHIDLFSLISAPNPTKVKTGTRPRAAHEVSLLTATASRVIDMKDTAVAEGQDRTSPGRIGTRNPTCRKCNNDGGRSRTKSGEGSGRHGAPVNQRCRKRGKDEAEANAPPKALRKDHAAFCPVQSTLEGKSLAPMVLDAGSTVSTPATQDTPTAVSDPDPLSYAKPQPHPERDIAQSSKKTATKIRSGNVATTEVQGVFSTKAKAKIARQNQRIQAREEEVKRLDQEIKSLRVVEVEVHGLRNQTKNLETLLEAEVDMKKTAKAKNAELDKELESLRVQFSDL
nr:hypothetical protein [Tanacetum cinerariifolium]